MIMNMNIKKIHGMLATKNLSPGFKVYDEKEINGYRIWNPHRSKLAAAILKGIKEFPLKRDSKVLYLGAASGTTASHVSDIVDKGIVYCVEFSPRVFSKLIEVCKHRENMIPILGDARKPKEYASLVGKVDVIYQDVAQPQQVDIALKNAKYFLKDKGCLFLVLKARSIDVTKKPEEILKKELKKLRKKFKIIDILSLEPYDKDHFMVLARLL